MAACIPLVDHPAWAEGGADRAVYRFDPAAMPRTAYSHTHACAFVASDPLSKRQRGLVPSGHVEVYDEENNQWCSVPQQHMPPNNYGAVEIEDWEPICHHEADAVFVYMPVNRNEIDEFKQMSTEVEASNELLLQNE
ncbi:hypothetical protein OS493_039912 [Desmophyllum pertusum]|uniref:Uncharacterized protein n=1 Tax=Desmophyllum pertusum TaxID=174260 RepID=A0A9W9Y9M1_9CNID|nr:hypothetical protein OS493_039912 [Desmophyllum pertusum]